MNVRVKPASSNDLALARNHFRAGANYNINAGLNIRIARLADLEDTPVAQTYISFHNTPMIEDHDIGDDGVDRSLRARDLRLAHAVADHLAAAKLHLFAISGEILLHLDEEFGISQANAVARGWAKH